MLFLFSCALHSLVEALHSNQNNTIQLTLRIKSGWHPVESSIQLSPLQRFPRKQMSMATSSFEKFLKSLTIVDDGFYLVYWLCAAWLHVELSSSTSKIKFKLLWYSLITRTNNIAWLDQVTLNCFNDPPALKGGVTGLLKGIAESYPTLILSIPLNRSGSDIIKPPKYKSIWNKWHHSSQ